MSKLLTEPRLPKEISTQKKRVKRVKTLPEDIKVEYTLLKETSRVKVDELFRVYKENPLYARVKFFNSRGEYNIDRLVIFQKGPVDFEIAIFRASFGISVTNRIYSSQKKLSSISYKNGKFYNINKNRGTIRPITYGGFTSFIQENEGFSYYSDELTKSKIYNFFNTRFPWIQMLSEHKMSMGVNFNVLTQKKLFGAKDITRHVMKTNIKTANLVMGSRLMGDLASSNKSPTRAWVETMKYLDGIENLTEELVSSHLFSDT